MAFENIGTGFLALIIVLIIWELIWKGIALWHSARNKHLAWFIFILVLNTAGILPIIYLLINKPENKKFKKIK